MTKDHPMLFSAPMVRALLAGTKSQTRRIINLAPGQTDPQRLIEWSRTHARKSACQYGEPGDLLWVRETCQTVFQRMDGQCFTERMPGIVYARSWIEYAATHQEDITLPRWCPSIHMPRSASRLTLRITEVGVQRLQELSEADAIAEGIEREADGWRSYEVIHVGKHKGERHPHAVVPNRSPIISYRELWESIHGEHAWRANPWVWVLTFETIQNNIDEVQRNGGQDESKRREGLRSLR